MMPFSVLRTLFTGLVGWAIFLVGIYLAYEAYRGLAAVDDGREQVTISREFVDERNPSQIGESDRQVAVVERVKIKKGWKPWAELVGAILCLSFYVGGRLPVRLFFSNRHLGPCRVGEITRAFQSRLSAGKIVG